MDASSSVSLNVYRAGIYINTFRIKHNNETVVVEHSGINTWRYTFQISNSTVTIRLISETEAEVTKEGSFILYGDTYQYSLSYTLNK